MTRQRLYSEITKYCGYTPYYAIEVISWAPVKHHIHEWPMYSSLDLGDYRNPQSDFAKKEQKAFHTLLNDIAWIKSEFKGLC